MDRIGGRSRRERRRRIDGLGHRVPRSSSLSTRRAFSRRNFGHTSSLNGTFGQLAEDAVEAEAHREVAGVHDLVGAAGVGVVDDGLRVVLRRERAGRVVEVRPLEHQLHGQVGPRLAAVAGDEAQLGEEPADLVDQLHVLARHRHPRTRHADAHEDRDVELDALGVDRVDPLVVDRHLRVAAGGEDLRAHARRARRPARGRAPRPCRGWGRRWPRTGTGRGARAAPGPSRLW